MLPIKCIFGQGYCYISSLVFTTDFYRQQSLPRDGVPWYCWNCFSQALLGRNTPYKLRMRHKNWLDIETNEAEFPSTFSEHRPYAISKHQSQPSPPANLACNLASTFPKHPSKILLPSAVHLEERLIVSQSVNQSGKQSVRQSVGQAGTQTETHSLGFFSGTLGYQQWEKREPSEQAMVQW